MDVGVCVALRVGTGVVVARRVGVCVGVGVIVGVRVGVGVGSMETGRTGTSVAAVCAAVAAPGRWARGGCTAPVTLRVPSGWAVAVD